MDQTGKPMLLYKPSVGLSALPLDPSCRGTGPLLPPSRQRCPLPPGRIGASDTNRCPAGVQQVSRCLTGVLRSLPLSRAWCAPQKAITAITSRLLNNTRFQIPEKVNSCTGWACSVSGLPMFGLRSTHEAGIKELDLCPQSPNPQMKLLLKDTTRGRPSLLGWRPLLLSNKDATRGRSSLLGWTCARKAPLSFKPLRLWMGSVWSIQVETPDDEGI